MSNAGQSGSAVTQSQTKRLRSVTRPKINQRSEFSSQSLQLGFRAPVRLVQRVLSARYETDGAMVTIYLSLVSRMRISGALPPSIRLYGVVLKQSKAFTCYVMWLLSCVCVYHFLVILFL